MRTLLVLLMLTTSASAETRWFMRLHVFFDDGLEILRPRETFDTEKDCIRVAERKLSQHRVDLKDFYFCERIHLVDSGRIV